MTEIVSFEAALEASRHDERVVLLGNGFSLAQGGGLFDYPNLLERCGLPNDNPIRNVFRTFKTVDFEEVMHALQHAAQIEMAYGDANRSKVFEDDADTLREALIHAVRAVHPGVQFDIPEPQRTACASFLKNFRSIYTLNYELLLYWVILKGARDIHSDGFGLGEEADGFRTFKADAKCSTYYLHGALHLFNNDVLATQKRVVTRSTIIDDIANTIRQTELLPLFVAECTTREKISQNKFCSVSSAKLRELTAIDGSIFIFGHSAGKSDAHIYEAIFRSRVKKILRTSTRERSCKNQSAACSHLL